MLIYKMWLGRNDALHTKEVINLLSGMALLDIEVEKEFDAGCEGATSMCGDTEVVCHIKGINSCKYGGI